MKFKNPFARKSSTAATSDIPEDLQPYYSGQSNGAKRWLGFALRILALLIVIVLIVWGGVWLVHKFSNRNTSTAKSNSSSQQATTQDKGNASTGQKSTNTPNSSQNTTNGQSTTTDGGTATNSQPSNSAGAASGTTGTTSSTPAATPGALTNTGPGETIALAFAAALVGVIGRYVWTLRRLSR